MKKIIFSAVLLLTLLGCSSPATSNTEQVFAMDTVMTLTAIDGDSDAVSRAVSQIYILESYLSKTREDSDIAQLNDAAGTGITTPFHTQTVKLLTAAQTLYDRTQGAFNPAVAPIMVAWGFSTEHQQVPDAEQLAQLLDVVHSTTLTCTDESGLLTTEDSAIDLGGIAKGFLADETVALFSQHGVTSALLDLGGNVTVMGAKEDGTPWRVAVKDPLNPQGYLGILDVTDSTLSTSGGYERYFEENGVTYHHIIDPTTGFPAQSGLLSVTVVSPNGVVADALSTALFVMGQEDALDFWRNSDDFEAIFVSTGGMVTVTEGLEAAFILEGSDYDYTYEIACR